MCPNCQRGLTEKKEVCEMCEGTGIARIAKVPADKKEAILQKVVKKIK